MGLISYDFPVLTCGINCRGSFRKIYGQFLRVFDNEVNRCCGNTDCERVVALPLRPHSTIVADNINRCRQPTSRYRRPTNIVICCSVGRRSSFISRTLPQCSQKTKGRRVGMDSQTKYRQPTYENTFDRRVACDHSLFENHQQTSMTDKLGGPHFIHIRNYGRDHYPGSC